MNIPNKIKNILEHPLVDTIAKFIKKFKSSKSYWSVSFMVLLFTIREATAWKWGSAIGAYAQKQLEGTDYSWLWTAVEFIFGFGGSWEFALGGFVIFVILSLVKISEGDNNAVTLKESFLSLLLLLTVVGMLIFAIVNTNAKQEITHKNQTVTHEKLDEIKALLKLQGGDETLFLKKYFGKDYAIILKNPQTYHNFTTLLKQTNKTADELLKEREELLKKIESQSFSPELQKQIDKAFRELRYKDARELIDTFLEANSTKEKELIRAHYIKALSYMEQIRYHEAKEEFENIAPNIDNTDILSDYAKIYYILGEYDKAIEYYEKSLKIQLVTLGENHPSTATTYNNIGSAWKSKGEYDKAIEYYEKSLKIQLATLGENHPDTATTYNNIGSAWKSKGKYDKAIEYYEKSLKIQLVTLGENHPDTATTYNNIGLVWKSKGEYDKAIEYYEKALMILRKVFPGGHPNIDVISNNLKNAKESLENAK
jgi:tetratricopeptide (TPR) repeat protein